MFSIQSFPCRTKRSNVKITNANLMNRKEMNKRVTNEMYATMKTRVNILVLGGYVLLKISDICNIVLNSFQLFLILISVVCQAHS